MRGGEALVMRNGDCLNIVGNLSIEYIKIEIIQTLTEELDINILK